MGNTSGEKVSEKRAAGRGSRARTKETPEEKAENKRRKAEALAAERRRLQAELDARLLDPPRFVEALRRATSERHQLVSLRDVEKGLKKEKLPRGLRDSFRSHWQGVLDAGGSALPAGVGSLVVRAGKTFSRKLFLLSDVVPSLATSAASSKADASSSASPLPLKQRLLTEFDRLNEQGGQRFYVSLFDLRRALADVPREAFDAALHELRRDWVLTLNPAEGRHEAVPAHLLGAGITEQSRVLVYVARRES